jgi:hypothetical protein
MAKVQANLEQQGTVAIDAEVQPVSLDLPKSGGFASTRQRFLSAFVEPKSSIPSAFLKSGESDVEQCY